jgi:gluconolactonase
MFAAPPELSSRVYAELPPKHRQPGRRSDWFFGKDDQQAHSFLEGPAIDREGHLWVSDIPFGRLFRISPEGAWSLALEYDGEPNGLALHRDGRVFIADHRRGLLAFDPRSGRLDAMLPRLRREGFRGLNDLTFAGNGDLYFTDQGQSGLQDPSGRLYRMRAATGAVDCVLEGIPSPNGLALTPDGRHLLLAVTRANQVWRLPLHPDGSTSKVAAFLQLSGGLAGPDGLAVDAEGNLAVAHCGLGTVWIFSRLGEPLFRIRSCRGLSTTNLCYRGNMLLITESDSGCVLAAELPVAGQGLYSHAEG